jgi:type I restriction enzyme S subunit
MAEQKRIADKLDTVLARVEACRERLDRVAPLLKRFRQSVLTAATAGRLTEDLRDDGDAGWTILRADDVCAKVQSGGTPKTGFTETTGIPFLKVYNIVDQRIDFEYRPQFVHPEVHAGELAKSRALPGDVLMNIVGPPLGKVAVLTDAAPEWNINQAITLFRPSERITSGWLYILLCEGAAVRSVLDRTKGSVGQVNISLSQCRAFEFPVPTIEEQSQVIRRVEILFAFADRLEARLALAQTAVDRLTPSLLDKAFRGELVPQDPADEPAASLLARLHQGQQEPAAAIAVKTPRGRPRKAA